MENKIRIALGTVYPYDENIINGGVEAVALYLVRALSHRDDIDLHVVSCSCHVKEDKNEIRDNVTFHWIAAGSKFKLLRVLFLDQWRVRRSYSKIRPAIIHAQGCSEYVLGVPQDIPMILTLHAFEAFAPVMRTTAQFRGIVGFSRLLFLRWFNRKCIRKADVIISIAGDYLERTITDGLKGKKICYIPNPIDEIFFSLPDVPECGQCILYVGTITERKNLLGLVRAFSRILRANPDAELRVAGSGNEKKYYADVICEVKRLGIEHKVLFLGQLNQKQLLREYDGCSFVVLPSIQETAPMAVAQAMARGKTVIASDVGGVSWMVGDTGYIFASGNEDQLSGYIVDLFENPHKRYVMGEAAKKRAKMMFDSGVVAKQTLQVYSELFLDGKNKKTFRKKTQ